MSARAGSIKYFCTRAIAGLLALLTPLACGLAVAGDALQGSRVGFQVVTSDDNAALHRDQVHIRYRGEIEYPFAANLTELWQEIRGRYAHVVLDLSSVGGSLDEARKAITTLQEMRQAGTLETRVRQGERCLSACVLLFAQGNERTAGGATVWMFHGACGPFTNVPSTVPTGVYADILARAGVDPAFLCTLAAKGYLSSPGKLWLSGYELFQVHKAGLITRLIDAWQPEPIVEPPFDPQIRSR